MIVDDVYANRFLIEELFSSDTVIGVANGEAMREALKKNRPDIILMDVDLPDEDGFELTKWLKERDAFKDIPIIFLTVHSTKEDVILGIQSGGYSYVTKPFDGDMLTRRVDEALAMKRLNEIKKSGSQ